MKTESQHGEEACSGMLLSKYQSGSASPDPGLPASPERGHVEGQESREPLGMEEPNERLLLLLLASASSGSRGLGRLAALQRVLVELN